MTKYGVDFPAPAVDKNVIRLINQIWKIIPMYENEENWIEQLKNVKFEILGWKEIFIQDAQFLQMLIELESLEADPHLEFDRLRKTVFGVIHLLQELEERHEPVN